MNQNTNGTDVNNIFVDIDGTVIMLTWEELFLVLAGCLHRRALANPSNLLGTMGTDIVRVVARRAYDAYVYENSARLFQVYKSRINLWFNSLDQPKTKRLEFDGPSAGNEATVTEDNVILRNTANGANIWIMYDPDSDILTVNLSPPAHFEDFMVNQDNELRWANNTYHTMHGGDFTGFEMHADFFSKWVSFPSDIASLSRLIEAVIPDLNRRRRPLGFPITLRRLSRRHANLTTRIGTRRSGTEASLTVGDVETFQIHVEQTNGTMDITLRPAQAFAGHMQEVVELGISSFDLDYAFDGRSQHFEGFTIDTQTGAYELLGESIDDLSIEFMEELVDTAVDIGMRTLPATTGVGPTTTNMGPTCPHCGEEVGEGGMAGMPCGSCARLGRL